MQVLNWMAEHPFMTGFFAILIAVIIHRFIDIFADKTSKK